jgi:DNA-binding NarL/FixJ family response regulator
MTPRTVAVVDDHALVRQGLVRALATQPGLEVEVVHDGDDPGAVLALEPAPALVLLDVDLDGTPVSVEVVRALVDRGCAILVVSALGDPRTIRALLGAGVAGFVSKRESTDSLVEAVGAVLRGESWTTPELAGVLASDDTPDRPSLSPQEHRALVLYASGLTLDSVARRMEVRPGTVREYLARVRGKYESTGRQVRTKTDLYREAVRDGYLDGPEPGAPAR